MQGKHLFSSQLCRLKGVALVQAQFFARCSSMADSDGRSKPAVTSRIRSRDQELGGSRLASLTALWWELPRARSPRILFTVPQDLAPGPPLKGSTHSPRDGAFNDQDPWEATLAQR